jgi:hypothetical protein
MCLSSVVLVEFAEASYAAVLYRGYFLIYQTKTKRVKLDANRRYICNKLMKFTSFLFTRKATRRPVTFVDLTTYSFCQCVVWSGGCKV